MGFYDFDVYAKKMMRKKKMRDGFVVFCVFLYKAEDYKRWVFQV